MVVTARFALLGEVDLFDTDAALLSEGLHGPLSESFAEYKLRMTSALAPDLVVLGSSRVMQLRDVLFDGCQSRRCFYNAGGAATTIAEASTFLDSLPRPPRVVLLGLDVWQFDPNDATNTHQPETLRPSTLERMRRALGIVREFTPRLYDDSELRSLIVSVRSMPQGVRGVRAVLRGEGFRPDGSYSYGAAFLSEVEAESTSARSLDALSRIARSCCRFEHFSVPDPRSLAELETVVNSAQARGTTVVVFTPPYSDEVVDAVERDPGVAAGFAAVDASLRDTFARLHVPFVSVGRASDIRCEPDEMLDGLHPSEVCAARLLAAMLSSGEVADVLRPYVTPVHLASLLAQTRSPLMLNGP